MSVEQSICCFALLLTNLFWEIGVITSLDYLLWACFLFWRDADDDIRIAVYVCGGRRVKHAPNGKGEETNPNFPDANSLQCLVLCAARGHLGLECRGVEAGFSPSFCCHDLMNY